MILGQIILISLTNGKAEHLDLWSYVIKLFFLGIIGITIRKYEKLEKHKKVAVLPPNRIK